MITEATVEHGIAALDRFDGKDNRMTIIDCFRRMGSKFPEWQAAQVRAQWLQWLVSRESVTFGGVTLAVTPCSPEDAYALFLQICANLGVSILEGVQALEEAVR